MIYNVLTLADEDGWWLFILYAFKWWGGIGAGSERHWWSLIRWVRIMNRVRLGSPEARKTKWSFCPENITYTHVFQPAFTVVLNPNFFSNHGTWEEPVTSWPQHLLYWDWVVSVTKTGGFWEPVRGIANGGSWVVIHRMEHSPLSHS